MGTAIRARNLVKHFGDIPAVDGLDLEVPEGRLFAFLGPNGAGKTTTLHLLLGLLRPDAGSIEVFGTDVQTDPMSVRRRSGVLLEHDGVYERLTVGRNLDLWGRLHGLSASARKERARTVLKGLDLYDRRRDRVRHLSRGMRRRLAIARALLPDPELVILDEPTVGLDPHAVAGIREHLRRLTRDEGTTVFLTTHNLAEAERVADRVAVIDHGRIVTTGTPTELAQAHGASRALILGAGLTAEIATAVAGLDGVLDATVQGHGDTLRLRLERDAPLAPLLRAVVDAGGEVEATTRQDESLEEIFLTLTRRDKGRQDTDAARRPRRPVPLRGGETDRIQAPALGGHPP